MTQLVLPPDWDPIREINSMASIIGIPLSVFLAGTIDLGASRDWQSIVSDELQNSIFKYVFNPRRVDWDSSWEQTPEHTEFNEQVTWELDHLDVATHVFFNFEGDSQSPVTMLELGERLGKMDLTNQKIIVVCPREFYRYGNVAITCKRYDVPVYSTIEEGIEALFIE